LDKICELLPSPLIFRQPKPKISMTRKRKLFVNQIKTGPWCFSFQNCYWSVCGRLTFVRVYAGDFEIRILYFEREFWKQRNESGVWLQIAANSRKKFRNSKAWAHWGPLLGWKTFKLGGTFGGLWANFFWAEVLGSPETRYFRSLIGAGKEAWVPQKWGGGPIGGENPLFLVAAQRKLFGDTIIRGGGRAQNFLGGVERRD